MLIPSERLAIGFRFVDPSNFEQAFVFGELAVVLIAAAWIARRHQRLFLASVMIFVGMQETRDFAPTLTGSLAGVSFSARDVIAVVAAVTALTQGRRFRLRRVDHASALLLGALIA